jgi:uncharacterized membrane protein YdbT with pleckstrin-like domain
MGFPRKLLNDGEDIVAELRPHWWVFVKPVCVTVLLFVLAMVAEGVVDNGLLTLVLAGLGLVSLVWLGMRWLRWNTTLFVITTDRLILRSGLLSKQGKEIPLERLNDIAVSQRLFERLIRSGDVMLESGGEMGAQVIHNIPRPFEVQNVVYGEIERNHARTADRMAGHRELSIPEQIEKLDELRQRGTISQAEFEAKKIQLLERM